MDSWQDMFKTEKHTLLTQARNILINGNAATVRNIIKYVIALGLTFF